MCAPQVPVEYFCNLDAEGRRRDIDERPELSCGTVEYVAPAEYMVGVLACIYGIYTRYIVPTILQYIRYIYNVEYVAPVEYTVGVLCCAR